MQSLVKQVDLQTFSHVCIMCHYIQLKTLTAESFVVLCTPILIQECGINFTAVIDIAPTFCISVTSLTKSLSSKMHIHSNSFIFMEFIVTYTVYCTYQNLELHPHVIKMKSSACTPTKHSMMLQIAVTWFQPYTLTADI
jgi:hypothetical protein